MPGVFLGWGQAMRTTATLDDALLARAEELCGGLERCALLKEALRAWCSARAPSVWQPWAAANLPWSRSPAGKTRRDPGRYVGVGCRAARC